MNRRRMMMLQQAKEEIPRERLVFSNAGDVIANGVTKTNDGAVVCGFAIIYQDYYKPPVVPSNLANPYWLYLILMTKSGRNDSAVIASKWAKNNYKYHTFTDGLVHSIPSTTPDCALFNTVEEGIAFINTININNLPIMNELTGKNYVGVWGGASAFSCTEAAQDLLDYYYGVL